MRGIVEESSGAEEGPRVGRPLLVGLASCVAGSLGERWLGTGGALLVVVPLLLGLRRLERHRRRPSEWGLGAGICALLFAVAALREAGTPSIEASRLEGRWTTVREGTELVGRLDRTGPLVELPRGAVREGERLRLLPTSPPPIPARGPIAPARRGNAHLPLSVSLDEIVRLGPPPPGPLFAARRSVQELRGAGLRRLAGVEDEATRGLAAALLFGDKGWLAPGTGDLFTRTGTRHALAVSGLHVAMVASLWIFPLGSLLAALLRLLARRRGPDWLRRPALWRALLLALFVPMAGAGAPVVRAGLALALAQLAGLVPLRRGERLRRRGDALSLWALAGWIEWLVSPSSLQSVSVQLSYTATLGLILLAPPMLRCARTLLPGGGKIDAVNRRGRERPLLPRLLAQKTLDWSLTGLVASFAANLVTLPIVWWTFGEWSPVGSIATLLLLPPLAAFIGLAWLWVLLPLAPLESLLVALTHGMISGLEFFDSLPGTPVPLPERPAWLLVVAGALVLLRPVPWRAVCLCWGLLLLPWRGAPRGLEVDLLEVGHGTALVLRAPGEPCWIFDAGSRDRPGVARQALFPLLRHLDPGQVAVVLSHTERDHAGALPWVIERFPPVVWAGALPHRIAPRLPRGCPRIDVEATRLDLRSSSSAEPALHLRLLRGEPLGGNEGSRSLEVSWGGHRLLFCGDAEGSGLRRILDRGEIEGPLSLLLLPHHGSESDHLGALLSAAGPREVWISSGEEPPVARELDRRGLDWSCTARDGPLKRRFAPDLLPR